MKIYLGDTFEREKLGYNVKFNVKNHLVSYWRLLYKRQNFEDYTVFKIKAEKNES